MNNIQCPHCYTSYAISDEQLRLSKGVVRCGACLERFNAHDQPKPEKPVFDPRDAFIEPLSHYEEEHHVKLDDIVPDTGGIKFQDSEMASVRLDDRDKYNFDTVDGDSVTKLDLNDILKNPNQIGAEQSQRDDGQAPIRPRLSSHSKKSIEENFDPELSLRLDEDEDLPVSNKKTTKKSPFFENQKSLQLNTDSSKSKSSKKRKAPSLKTSKTNKTSNEHKNKKRAPSLKATQQQKELELAERSSTISVEKEKPSIEPERSSSIIIQNDFDEDMTRIIESDEEESSIPVFPIDDEIDAHTSTEAEVVEEIKPEKKVQVKPRPKPEKRVARTPQTKPAPKVDRNKSELDLFSKPNKQQSGTKFKPWALTLALSLCLVILVSGLIYQLWQKQLVSEKLQDTIAPVSEPLLEKLKDLNVEIPTRRDLESLELVSARTEPHAEQKSTILPDEV